MLTARNLTKDYTCKGKSKLDKKMFRAIHDISFDINQGDFIGYIGPNGAGKSTTIKIMCGILTPTTGSLTINGITPYKDRKKNAKQIGVLFGQKSQLWYDLPLYDTLKLHKEMYDISENDFKKRYNNLKEMLDLDTFEEKPVRTLSLGQRMRGELAVAVLHNPPLLILDEPTIGMDIIVKERIRTFLIELNQKEGTTIILTTHDMSDIEKTCKKAILINQGRKLFDGDLEILKNNSQADSKVNVKLANPLDRLLQSKIRNLNNVAENTYSFSLNRQSDEVNLLNEILNKNKIIDLYISEPTLEDVISSYFER